MNEEVEQITKSLDEKPIIVNREPGNKRKKIDIPEFHFSKNSLLDDENVVQNLLFGIMSMPIRQIPSTIPYLEKFTIHEISKKIESLLENPPHMQMEDFKLPIEVPFTALENFELLKYIDDNFFEVYDDILDKCRNFMPSRSLTSIMNQLERLKLLSDEEKNEIINQLALEILDDELTYIAVTKAEKDTIVTAPFLEVSAPPISDEAIKEINALNAKLPLFLRGFFSNQDLALLCNESQIFFMRKAMITLGRTEKADINLELINCEKTVPRICAVIAFKCDTNFYIENISSRSLRVNGFILEPGEVGSLPKSSIIDICGTILFFALNEKLVRDIQETMNRLKHKKNSKRRY